MKNTDFHLSGNIPLSPNARYILEKRYLKKNESGQVAETPADMFHRVAGIIASAELGYNQRADTTIWEKHFFNLMANLEFLPNSPTLLNAGRFSGQLSSCFMLPVEDQPASMNALVREAELVHASGGGTGFNFSELPASRRAVNSIHPLSTAVLAVRQGGIRQGCSIVVLDVRHPDILDFIRAKDDPKVLANFYLAVGITEEFMRAVQADEGYDLINPVDGSITGHLSARVVFAVIVNQTWKTGDPGIVFLDRMEKDNPVPHLGKIGGVSGCGEQMLMPYESCNLGSINLAKMLAPGGRSLDYAKLSQVVKVAVRFLDNVIDVNHYPLPQIQTMTKKTRKIGLGVMGFADLLVQLGIPYDSESGLQTAGAVMNFINAEAHRASSLLAEERGTFPAYEGSIYDKPGGVKMRNASCTTIAPTGTISLIAGCSNGIEPLFALVYARHILDGDSLMEVNPYFVELAKKHDFYCDDLIRKLAAGTKLAGMASVPQDIKRLFISAPEIKTEWHVRMQAAFQKHVDNAVSKTVNLPQDATLEDVAQVYRLAYTEGLKGITVYRDQSRPNQPLANSKISNELLTRFFKDTQDKSELE
jgi:ribonucleoside-diphosphate reductase alpha chain